MPADQRKACNRCRAIRPLSEFPKRSDRPGSYGGECKGCRSARQRERYQKNMQFQ